ncbi:AAA family ATPase [Methanoculleus sp. UBA430]|uniref:AAA family ATPase n=1 Tax=Methanoculleus sp. UBA430 TaxID=1915511 RepID=UPI0025ED31CF|nr:MoxR family ATPase [Methanoculleus sp. UBA430]
MAGTDTEISALNSRAREHAAALDAVRSGMETVIIGQQAVIDQVLAAVLAGGHALLEGVPGIAKTLTISTLAHCLDCTFARIQFTPDLLPADITGTRIYDRHTAAFRTIQGPIFHQIILADEINRAPPKVQSALLEAMQERQVTIQGETYPLPRPFFVLATQNPLESEGTYPLPEAQLDRFMLKIQMDYPTLDEEVAILDRFTAGDQPGSPVPVLDAAGLAALRSFVRSVYADPGVKRYAAQLVDATRHPAEYGLDLGPMIASGASPRASLALLLCGKAHAVLAGRGYVVPDDIRALAPAVLRHRVLLTFEAEADDLTSEEIVRKILAVVEVP